MDEKKIAIEKWLQAWLETKLKLFLQSNSKFKFSFTTGVLQGLGL